MDRNISLLKDLVLLAVLKRLRDLKRRKNNVKYKTDDKSDSDDESRLDCEAEFLSDASSESNSFQETTDLNPKIITYRYDKQTDTIQKCVITENCKEFQRIKELRKNLKSKRVVCEICGKIFNEKNIKFHMNKHKNNYPHKCNIDDCKKAFTSAQMLKQHQHFHCQIKRNTCDICNRSFYMPSSLRNHRLLHSDPTIECEECGKMFYTRFKLKVHNERVHLCLKKYSCNECDKRYVNHGSLRKHLIAVHKQQFVSQRIRRE